MLVCAIISGRFFPELATRSALRDPCRLHVELIGKKFCPASLCRIDVVGLGREPLVCPLLRAEEWVSRVMEEFGARIESVTFKLTTSHRISAGAICASSASCAELFFFSPRF